MERVHQAVRRECARLLDSTLALSLFLANAVVFLPLVLRQGTHRNAIQLSRCVASMIAHNGTNVNKTRTSACGQRIIHPRLKDEGFLMRYSVTHISILDRPLRPSETRIIRPPTITHTPKATPIAKRGRRKLTPYNTLSPLAPTKEPNRPKALYMLCTRARASACDEAAT
jgi:hypothetical protein